MMRWGLRHRGFRISFICVVVCSIFYIIGFSAPAWRNTMGLWMFCTEDYRLCVSHAKYAGTIHSPAWFVAVRTFECLGLIGILLCVAAELFMDCFSELSTDRRLVELLALVAGACGLTGSIIFSAYTPINSSNIHRVYLGWGFGLSTASSSFLIICACMIAYFRRKGLDIANYAPSNAMHYCISGDAESPEGVMDLAPPTYNEVVRQPSSQAGRSHWSSTSQYGASVEGAYFKASCHTDTQPPPAYYPPPPSGQFQAPPAYTFISAYTMQQGQSSTLEFAEGGSANVTHTALTCPGARVTSPSRTAANIEVTEGDLIPTDESPINLSGPDSNVSLTSSISTLPVYYVTVLGQMVPVYWEELQQAGREVPSIGAPVPAYFIVVQGQHVPVYNEEQARMLAN